MAQWHLSESYQTIAGTVAAGSGGTGPALVLAHGWPWSSYAWDRIIPALTQRFTVYWYDMPGYGRSDAFEGQLDQIRCPVHVIWGKDDPWIPVTRGKALQAKIGTASLTLLSGVGHLPQLEAPEAVLAALHDLI